MFLGCILTLLFYKYLQLCRYLCPGHELDPVSGESVVIWVKARSKERERERFSQVSSGDCWCFRNPLHDLCSFSGNPQEGDTGRWLVYDAVPWLNTSKRVFRNSAKLKSLTILQGGMWYDTIPDAEYCTILINLAVTWLFCVFNKSQKIRQIEKKLSLR